jgi:hypothetical protein
MGGSGVTERVCVCVLFIGTQFSNLYTAVDTPEDDLRFREAEGG